MSTKKFFTIFMIIFMLFSVSGCGGSGGHTQNITNNPVSPDKPVPIPEPQSDDITIIPEPSPLSQDKPVSQEPIPTPIISHDPVPTPILYTVTFNSNGGSAVSSLTVSSGNTVTKPNDPSKYGYTFDGWYKDSALTQVFRFGSNGDKVTGNITLYAKWIENDRLRAEIAIGKISIGYQDEDNASNVTKNLTLPTSINVSGDVNISWSSNTPSVISNSGTVTRPSGRDIVVVLTAKATAGSASRTKTFTVTVIHEATPTPSGYTVTFNSNGGSTVASIHTSSDGTVIMPENPVREGYVFAGWYKDEAFTEIFTFGADGDKITKDTTLYAQWVKTDTLKANYAIGEIVIGYADGDNPKYVTRNLTLPSKAGASRDVNIIWSSSNSAVIDSAGTVTRPSGSDTNVTLTARAISGTETSTRNFSLKVICAHSRESRDVEVMFVQDAGSGDLCVTYKASSDQIIDIEGNYSKIVIQNADDALDAIQAIHRSLGISNPYNELQTFLATSDDYGAEYSFQQVYNGVKVFGRSVMVSTNASSEGDFLHSSFLASRVLDSADMRINLTSSNAEARAKSVYSRDVEVDTQRTELVVYSLENYNSEPVYAYIVRVYSTSVDSYIDDNVFVNAVTGEIIMSYPNICDAIETYKAEGWNELHRRVSFDVVRSIIGPIAHISYVMHDPNLHILLNKSTRLLLIPVDNQFNNWSDTHQVSVYSNMREVMSWWREKFDRDSIDGKGTTVDVVTHAIGKNDQAYWNSCLHRIFVYDRAENSKYDYTFGAAIDVMTHETTHGVMQYIAGDLPSRNATGAIKEAYADILACVKDEDWMFGDKLFNKNNKYKCIRNIINPESYDATGKMRMFLTPELMYQTYKKESPSDSNDNNYVHQYSHIISHTAYLMHKDSNSANGLTWEELGKVWYKSMHMGLSSSSNFGDVRRCVLWAAVKLNLPDNKIAAIKYAFDEVKIDDSTRKATLQGSVSDYSTSEFISGVDVTLLGTTVSNTSTVPYFIGKDITPRSGRYSFQLEAGKYTVFVAKEGYVTLSAFPSMTSKDVTMDVRLVRPGNGSLSGKAMKSGDKSPLQRVTVNVRSGWYTQNAPVFQTTSTDANGEYSFPSLNNGYYTVELRKSGYKIATFNVIVSGNTTGQVWNMEEGIDIENGIPINEEYFPDEYFRWYLNRNIDSDKDGILSKAELESTTRIDLGGHHYCTSLQGIKYFVNLQHLWCTNGKLTALDVSGCKSLKELYCSSNLLTYLNINGCSSLLSILCMNNNLTFLDVSECMELQDLYCDGNKLILLDVSNNTALIRLSCSGNQLTTLDVSNNTALTRLWCSNNQLTALDLRHNTALDSLLCMNNQLTTLNVEGCIAIKTLECYSNQLKTLDVSDFTSLERLDCKDNQLVALNVSNCIVLRNLNCLNNRLTTLNLSNCQYLHDGIVQYGIHYDRGVVVIWYSSSTPMVSAPTVSSSGSHKADYAPEILATLPPFTPSQSGTYTLTVSLDRTPPEDSSLLLLSDSEDLNASFALTDEEDTVRLSADFTAGKLYTPVIVANTEQQEQSGGCNSGTLGMVLLVVLLKKRIC